MAIYSDTELPLGILFLFFSLLFQVFQITRYSNVYKAPDPVIWCPAFYLFLDTINPENLESINENVNIILANDDERTI